MLSTKQMAEIIGKSRTTVIKWMKHKEVKPYTKKIGRETFFYEDSIPFMKSYKPKRKERGNGNEYRDGNTICWHCKTNPNECMWIRFHVPVKGWVAELVKNSTKGVKESYRVIECPCYKQERK